MRTYLAIDIGGTDIKYALIDENTRLHEQQQIPTPNNQERTILEAVVQIIENMQQQHTISAVGISTAGIVDRSKGEIIYAGPTIPNYQGTNFKQRIKKQFDLPVHVENDVNAALLGEQWLGAAQQMDDIFCITLGTGIGGAYYNGKLQDGANHQANSVGYLLYDPETQANFEQRASTAALNQQIRCEISEGLSAKDVFERAITGNHDCLHVIEDWTTEIAKGLAQIILLYDPSCLIIGGGVSKQGDFLLNQIQQQIPSFLPDNFYKTKIKMAALFNDAALYGAVSRFFS